MLAEHLVTLETAGDSARVAEVVRTIFLYFLDDQWVVHLAVLQEIRDGIHLRALAGQKPLDEFHRATLREFHNFFDTVYARTAEFVETLTADDIGVSLEEFGLRRPSATWTYMITDDPFGNHGDRFIRRTGKFIRSKVLRLE